MKIFMLLAVFFGDSAILIAQDKSIVITAAIVVDTNPPAMTYQISTNGVDYKEIRVTMRGETTNFVVFTNVLTPDEVTGTKYIRLKRNFTNQPPKQPSP